MSRNFHVSFVTPSMLTNNRTYTSGHSVLLLIKNREMEFFNTNRLPVCLLVFTYLKLQLYLVPVSKL
uniref:Uncharacterized protein n=1 Tax=Arundo donax TaxID=35708 RepID=A0A0A9GT55_ARUDO